MSTWNDDRLDELSRSTDEGFERVDQQFEKVDKQFEKVDRRFDKVDEEFKEVRQEMKEGFAKAVTRDEMDQRFNAVDKRLGDSIRWMQAFTVLGGGAILGNGIFG